MAQAEIKVIQTRLKGLGYDLGRSGPAKDGVDGDFGDKSQKATIAALVTGKAAEKPATTPMLPGVTPGKPAGAKLDARAEKNLIGVHPDLIRIVRRAAEISTCAFTVTCGVRTLKEQEKMVAQGASQTMNSRHLPAGPNKLSHAVDLAAKIGNTVKWDWPLYEQLARAMKQAARELGIPIEWGGDWTSLKDGPHFQLPFSKYPK